MKGLILFLSITLLQTNLAFATHNPKLEITPDSWDFGKATEAENLKHNFKIKNSGDDTLEIKHLTTSCVCLKVSIPFYKLYPKEAMYLTVSIDVKQLKTQGKIKEDVFIESNDPQNHFQTVSVFIERD